MSAHRTNFIKWYVRPFNRLKGIKGGDGAFVILTMGLFLCERYYRIKSGCITRDSLSDKFYIRAARDFDCDVTLFKRFWAVYRHGMQHRGHPQRWIMESEAPGVPKKKVRLGWMIDAKFGHRPSLCRSRGKRIIAIDPAKFTRFMLSRFLEDPSTLDRSIRHQFGTIFPIPGDCKCEEIPFKA